MTTHEQILKEFNPFDGDFDLKFLEALSQARLAAIRECMEAVHLLQKQCSKSDGTIDGITALHETLANLERLLSNE